MLARFDNSYATLPERFYARLAPEPVSTPAIIRVNDALAEQLGLDPAWLRSAQGAQVAAGNQVPDGAAPIATVYAGHQFGHFNPQLGDGRAILLGEVIDRHGQRYDLQLKGSGPTPYSRGGDGRSPLGPVLREYIISEAMHALGIPTTRSLAAVTTGERVLRDSALPGAVLTRVAKSHIRIGTCEYFAAREDSDALALLVDHVVRRHYPEIAAPGGSQTGPTEETARPNTADAALALFKAVALRQAELVAKWQLVGFIHGVMNTDNMLLSGETIDYGPCAFMDAYDPQAVFSYIDRRGRYAYRNQPGVAQWNLTCLARALTPLLNTDDPQVVSAVQKTIDAFPAAYARAYSFGMARKLGITPFRDGDAELVDDLLRLMHEEGADYTLTFRRLSELAAPAPDSQPDTEPNTPDSEDAAEATGAKTQRSVAAIADLPAAFEPWLARWRARYANDPEPAADRKRAMLANNPAIIPRNHQVDKAIRDAEQAGDFTHFHKLVDALADPYTLRAEFARPPEPDERVSVTFCGT
ncbi:MAG: YdiU family protein [Haliangiales bacterium]